MNKHTGEAHQVPVGIDPGFDYNPGQKWLEAPVKSDPMKELPGDEGTTRAGGEGAQKLRPDMAEFLGLQSPDGEMVAGELSPAALATLGAETSEVTMDAQFVIKQRRKRGNLPIMTYALIPELLANPAVILDQGDRRVLLMLRAGDLWSGAVKTTRDKKKNYLLNFRRSNPDDVKRLLARDRLVFGALADLEEQ